MPILVLGTHGPTASSTFTHMTVRSLEPSPGAAAGPTPGFRPYRAG